MLRFEVPYLLAFYFFVGLDSHVFVSYVAAEDTKEAAHQPTISEIISGVSEFKGAVSHWMESGIATLKEGTVVAMANLTSHGRPRTEARPLVGHGHGHTHCPPTHPAASHRFLWQLVRTPLGKAN